MTLNVPSISYGFSLSPVGYTQPMTRTYQNPYPCVWVRVLTGTGTGCPEKPQGSPCHSLVVTKVLAPRTTNRRIHSTRQHLKPERLVVTKHGISGVSTQILVNHRKQTNDGTIQTRDISCTRNHRTPTRNISALRI